MEKTQLDDILAHPLMVPAWTFGDRLRKARVLAGWTQADMAKQLNVSAGGYAQWEADNNKPREIVAVANAIQALCMVPAWWILDVAPQPVDWEKLAEERKMLLGTAPATPKGPFSDYSAVDRPVVYLPDWRKEAA